MYTLEAALVDDFLATLAFPDRTPWGVLQSTTEFDYRRGRADIIAVTNHGDIVSFEAKLSRWREAMHQAYRNTCFADYSYVILPEKVAIRAANYAEEFARRSVGICYLSGGRIVIEIEAKRNEPLQPWLSDRAISLIEGRSVHDD